MINEATKIFIPSSFGGNVAASNECFSSSTYYEHLVYTAFARGVTTDRLNLLGSQLASLARLASLTRRPDDVENINQLIRALPLPKSVQALTHYYEGLRLGRVGEFDAAERILYKAAENVATEYRPRVFLALANNQYDKGDVDAAVPFFLLAGKLGRAHDPIAFLESEQVLGYIQGASGDYSRAVKSLESIFPSVLAAARTCPIIYYVSLNNYAVRLGKVGRVDEAEGALNIALNSRHAAAFPEWAETRTELETKRRHPRPSFVALSSFPETAERKPPKKKLQRPKPKRRRVGVVVRALHWLAGLSIFRSFSFAPILTKPISVALEALPLITSDWPTSGPGPRAPPFTRPTDEHLDLIEV